MPAFDFTTRAYSTTVGEAWSACCQQQMSQLDTYQDDPTRFTDVTVTSTEGRVALTYVFSEEPDSDQIYYFVATEQAAGSKIPLRYFLQQPGAEQNLIARCHYIYDPASRVLTINDWILSTKVAIITDLTDGIVTSVDEREKEQPVGQVLTHNVITTAEAPDQYYATVDTVRVGYGAFAPPGNEAGISFPTVRPGYTPPPAGIPDMGALIKVLQDIALRDFTVRFNHGAQQFSAEGGVAIP